MNKLKKLGALILVIALALSLVGCSGKEKKQEKTEAEETTNAAPEEQTKEDDMVPETQQEEETTSEEESEEVVAEEEKVPAKEPEDIPDATEVEKYVEENGDSLMSGFVFFIELYSGTTCKYTVKGEGNDIIAELRFDGKNDLSDEEKAEIQETYGAKSEDIAGVLAHVKADVPSLERVIIYLCEEDGDNIAVINVDM